MKKIILFLSLCIVAMSFSGCSIISLDARSLITPPKANQDQEAIEDLMQTANDEVVFIYPKSGDYRSAVIMQDLDADGTKEALGFCSNQDGGISFLIMSKNEEWKVVSSFENTGTQVHRVFFGDLDGDGNKEIIVGWGSPQSLTATITVYQYEKEEVKEFLLDHTYNEFVVADLDGDNTDEIFTATIFVASEESDGLDQNAVARVFNFKDKPVLKSSCILNNNVTKYTMCSAPNISVGNVAVVLESSLTEGGTSTQVLEMEDGALIAPLSFEENVSAYNYFTVPSIFSLQSKDINGDGIVEFPKIVPQDDVLTQSESSDQMSYYVDWVKLSNYTYSEILVMRSIMNTNDNFMFEVDADRVVQSRTLEKGVYEVTEKIYDDDGKFLLEKSLFTIEVFTARDWEEHEYKSIYGKIFSVSNNICAVLNMSNENEEIIDTLRAINE